MPIEERAQAAVITHALARATLTTLRDENTSRAEFRNGLVRLGRLCGSELVDGAFEREQVTIQTPMAETTGERVAGRDDVVLVTILRAAAPFVDGLLDVFPDARVGVISASRDEHAGMDDAGRFPIAIDYETLPSIAADDTVIVADPMLATGSTMCAVLDRLVDRHPAPSRLFVLSAVSAPAGLDRVNENHPAADLVTVAIDDRLDENGFIVPGLGDAGDRAFGTA